MPLALAIDLGTTSTAAVAVDERGRLVNVVRQHHDAAVSGLPEEYSEQSPQRHWETALAVLTDLVSQLTDQPVCLGLTGQMHSVMLINDEQQPLSNLITWQDRRANELVSGESTA